MSSDFHTFHIHSQFTQLLAHIRRGQLEPIIDLLSSPTLANQVLHLRDRNGRTALHQAADTLLPPTPPSNNAATTTTKLDPKSRSNQLFDIAQQLIKHSKGALLECQDNEGNTPLHLAVINGNLGLTKLMLRSQASGSRGQPHVNLVDYELHSAVHWATVCGELECLAVVLDAGADISTPDIYGAHPLHYATQSFAELNCLPPHTSSMTVRGQQSLFGTNGSGSNSLAQQKYSARRANGLRILHHLLARPNIDVNCSDNEGRTPLLWAASSGNSDALLALVKAGAEISQQDKDGLSALHCASSRGHYKCAEILIMICGADVHQIDSSGCTPLFYAAALGHPDCVRLLLESGADVDHQDHKGRTAAHCGASKGQLETVKILHQQGANLWLKNVRGDLPLHEAIKSGRRDLVKWLLDLNPKAINEVNLYGRSALHIAAFNNNADLCRLLVERGADLNAVMKVRSQYLTPLDAAHQNASEEVARYLASVGAQPIAQIDERLAEYLQNTSPIKELGARRQRRQAEEAGAQGISGDTFETTKLPNLIGGDKEVPSKADYSRTALSTSASSSTIDAANGYHHHHHHHQGHHANPNSTLHNCREFDTNLQAMEKPTHLKQAIITNVYLTAGVPAGMVTGGVHNGAASRVVAPVYYVKRVPPLKKGHHQMKGTSGGGGGGGTKRRSGGGDSRSRSRSKDQQATMVSNGGGSAVMTTDDDEFATDETGNMHYNPKTGPAKASVILETHDTYESEMEMRDEKLLITQELTTENGIASADDDGKKSKSEQKQSTVSKTGGNLDGSAGGRRGKRSVDIIADDGDDDQAGKEKQDENENDPRGSTTEEPVEVVEPLRTQHDDSGFETEAASKAALAKENVAKETTDSSIYKVSKTESTKEGSRWEEERKKEQQGEEDTDKKKDDQDDQTSEKSGFFSKTTERLKETTHNIVEETKEFIEETFTKEMGAMGLKRGDSTTSSKAGEKGEEGKVSKSKDGDETDKESLETTQRDFVDNVEDEEEEEEEEEGIETEEAESKAEEEKEVRKKRSISGENGNLQAESDDKQMAVNETKSQRNRFSKSDSRTSIGSVKSRTGSVGSAKSVKSTTGSTKSPVGSAKSTTSPVGSHKSSRASSREGSAKSTKLTEQEAEDETDKPGSQTTLETLDKEDDGEEVEEEDQKEPERSVLGNMVEDGDQEEGEETEDEPRKKQSIGEEEEETKSKDEDAVDEKIEKDEDQLRRASKQLDPIVEMSFEGSAPDLRKGSKGQEVVEAEVHAQRSVDVESVAEEVIVPKKIEVESDDDKYGKLDDGGDNGAEEDKVEEGDENELDKPADEAPNPRKSSKVIDGFAEQVVTGAKEEGFEDLKKSDDEGENASEGEEIVGPIAATSRRSSLKPVVVEQRRKRSVSYDTAADLRSLVREPEKIQDKQDKSEAVTEEHEKDEEEKEKEEPTDEPLARGDKTAASSTFKLSRSSKEAVDDVAGSSGSGGETVAAATAAAQSHPYHQYYDRLDVPGAEQERLSGGGLDDDDAISDAATFDAALDGSTRRVSEYSSDIYKSGSKSYKYKTNKKYEHIGPKVDSYWNYEMANSSGRKLQKSRGGGGGAGSKEMIPGAVSGSEYAEEQYAKINPKIINQTVEKYLRKYYLERKLFEELYDLKRYQIRTGKSNEPQAVKRLVEKFRRDVRAPGMADFKGPMSYRAYEMYLYDQLRKLSRSNERKIAFLDKSVSYEDLNSSFDKSDVERSDHMYASGYESSPTREPRTGGGGRRKSSRKTRTSGGGPGTSTDDPLLDYDAKRPPYGLSFDYKYEYHKSQHMDRAGKELVDVICENLYKRTGMHGAKVDEVAISRKVVERKSGDGTEKTEETEERRTGGDDKEEPNESETAGQSDQVSKRFRAEGRGSRLRVAAGDGRGRSRIGGRGGRGSRPNGDFHPLAPPLPRPPQTLPQPSRQKQQPKSPPPHPSSSSLLSGPPLSSFFRRPKLKREPMAIPPRTPIAIPREDIERRWAEVKRRERQRRQRRGHPSDCISYFHHSPVRQTKTTSSADAKENVNVSLWFELNKRPWREYYQNLGYLDRYCLYNNNYHSYCSSPLLFSAAAAAQLQLHKLPPDWHIRASSRLQRTHSDPDSIFDR